MADRNTTPFRLRLKALLNGMIGAVGVLLGLALIHSGTLALFAVRGKDFALPSDAVGELEVISTRSVALQGSGLGQILLGLALVGLSLYAVRWLQNRAEG